MRSIYSVSLLFILTLFSCKSSKYAELGDGLFADIQTSMGDIVVKLEYEKTPVTVANFVTLAEGTNPFVSEEYAGKPYYNGLTFHRVMKDFMIQGGDPTASGTGSPGYKFKDEFDSTLIHNKKGILSMANPGPMANGSQFFITVKETPWLDGRHSVFGEVVSGLGVIDSISVVPTDERDKPITPVIMNEVKIVRKGTEAKDFDAVAVFKGYFAEEQERLAAIEKAKAELAVQFAEQKEKAEELASGLRIFKIKEGSGEKPAIGQKVLVNYAGWLPDGTLFDTCIPEVAERSENYAQIKNLHRGDLSPSPMDYSPDARLIAGFKEGLLSLKPGDKVRLFIPPHLGYGPQGGGPIPPNSELIFDLELLGPIN